MRWAQRRSRGSTSSLDLAHRKLNLVSPEHCKDNVVYWAADWSSAPLFVGSEGNFYFPVELVTRRMYGFDATSAGIETVIGPDGGIQAHFRAMRLAAPGLDVRNTKVELVDPLWTKAKGKMGRCSINTRGRRGAGYTNCGNVVPMYLGRNVLETLRFYFATSEKIVYFTLAETTKP